MSVKLLTEHYLEFLGLKGGFTGSSESTLVKIPHCWKSHVVAQIICMYMYVVIAQHIVSGFYCSNGVSLSDRLCPGLYAYLDATWYMMWRLFDLDNR